MDYLEYLFSCFIKISFVRPTFLFCFVSLTLFAWQPNHQNPVSHIFEMWIRLRGGPAMWKIFSICRTQEGPAYTWLLNFHTFARSLGRLLGQSLARLVSEVQFWSLHIH